MDTYYLRGRIANSSKSYEVEIMFLGCTCFAAEALLLPKEIIETSLDIFSYQELHIYYDADGEYRDHYVSRIDSKNIPVKKE